MREVVETVFTVVGVMFIVAAITAPLMILAWAGRRRAWRALRRAARMVTDDGAYMCAVSLFASRSRERRSEAIATVRDEIVVIRHSNMIKVMLMRANLVAWKRDPRVVIDQKSLIKYVEDLREAEEEYGLNVGVKEP